MELIRFFAVAVSGLIIDISIAWLFYYQFEVLLTLSSAIGFLSAAAINYVMHELWTFKNGQRTLSSRRAFLYIGVLTLTIVTRLTAVHALQEFLLPDKFALLILTIAAAVSFTVNFVSSKFLVFKPKPSLGEPLS